MVLFVVHNFQNGGKSRMLRNVSINFLLFYKNNVMLKTDIMLDYWPPYKEKGCIIVVENYSLVSVEI